MSGLRDANAFEDGARAYGRSLPIWANPHVSDKAEEWRLGYRKAQAENGNVTYEDLPPRTHRPLVLTRKRGHGRGDTFNTR